MRKILLTGFVAISLIYTAGAMTDKTFDVRQYGAKGDGKTIDTEAIQKALDECGSSGGGIVKLSAGVFLSKPIHLRSNTTLQIDEDAKLKATDEPLDFLKPGRDLQNLKGSGDFIAFVNGKNLTNVSITGKGTIDGSGVRWWIPAEEARKYRPGYTSPRPRLILIEKCTNLKITGITICNSPSFHLVPKGCENVLIEGVTIRAPSIAPNTDAIDPSVSRNVLISKCLIDIGDDNVAIKSGSIDPAHPNAACENITVADCVFLHGHGMSIGSETNGGVRNLVVKRCIFKNMASGVRIKSARGKGGLIENISYSDIIMRNVRIPIDISSFYQGSKDETPEPINALTPIFRNIRIKNIDAVSPYGEAEIVDRITDFLYYYYAHHAVLEPRNAGVIIGLPESYVSDVVMENINIRAETGMTIQNAENVRLKNVNIDVQQGPPFILKNADVKGLEQTNN
jgi:polygalacturonase